MLEGLLNGLLAYGYLNKVGNYGMNTHKLA